MSPIWILIATVQTAEAPPQNIFSQHVFTERVGEGGQNPLPPLAQLKTLIILTLSLPKEKKNSLFKTLALCNHC